VLVCRQFALGPDAIAYLSVWRHIDAGFPASGGRMPPERVRCPRFSRARQLLNAKQ
jgi:hypothetical protein